MLKGSISDSRTPDQIVLNTISEIGRFEPTAFYTSIRKKSPEKPPEHDVSYNAEGVRSFQAKHTKIQKNISGLEHDISVLRDNIERHKQYMGQLVHEHDVQKQSIMKQIQNRKLQVSKIENSQEPPTTNQIFALVRQIQVEGMAAKRRAENCLKDQDVNIVLSGERIKRFHDSLYPKANDGILNSNPKLRKSYERLESGIFRVSEIQTLLRSLKVYSTNLERRIIEMNSQLETLQFDKADLQMAIVDKKEELHSEMTKRSEELGKMKWKIEYMKSLKVKMNEPHFNVRNIE